MVVIAATVGSLRLEFVIPVCSPSEAQVLVRIALTTSLIAGLGLIPFVVTGDYARDAQGSAGPWGVALQSSWSSTWFGSHLRTPF